MKVGVGADHGGFEMKEQLARLLAKEGHEVVDFGNRTYDTDKSSSYSAAASIEFAFSPLMRCTCCASAGTLENSASVTIRKLLSASSGRRSFRLEADQLPRFDLVLLGMGAEGHTASLFAGTKALKEERRLVVSNWVEKLYTHRITLTPRVLNNAARVVFMVHGKEKALALKAVLEGRTSQSNFRLS
jgi:hypothetical protein